MLNYAITTISAVYITSSQYIGSSGCPDYRIMPRLYWAEEIFFI